MREDFSVPAVAAPLPSKAHLLLQLAERCKREEPDWRLDDAIAQAALNHPPCGTAGPPRFTASLDAAVTLQQDGQWGIAWDIESVFAEGFPGNVAICAYVWAGHCTNETSYVRSPGVATYKEAIAWLPRLICAAALRARAAVEPAKDGMGASNASQP